MKKTLLIIGAGKMGAALAHGLHASKNFTLLIADKHEENLKKFTGIQISTNPLELTGKADAVLIAVKPQSFDTLMEELGSALQAKLVISIMAGKTLSTLQEKTNSGKIVRSMPNIGAAVGQSMTAWIASRDIDSEEKKFVRSVFQSIGKEILAPSEEHIDRFSVICGCGPAYFFRLCELMQRKSERLGFSTEESRMMVEETFIASAKLLEQGERTTDEWVKAVASKGGMTEAALRSLDKDQCEEIFSRALDKALNRSKELNG